MIFKEDVMPPAQRVALHEISSFLVGNGFYLAGGTALAILIGHRRSVDLDWFRQEPIVEPESLVSEMRSAGIGWTGVRVARGTVHGHVNGVSVSLFEYDYPLLAPLINWPELPCHLASLPDIAAMKLSAVVGRGSRKDLVDVHALISDCMPLPEMLSAYATKFGTQDCSSVLYSLVYFDDAETERMPAMLNEVNWTTVKAELTHSVREYAGMPSD